MRAPARIASPARHRSPPAGSSCRRTARRCRPSPARPPAPGSPHRRRRGAHRDSDHDPARAEQVDGMALFADLDVGTARARATEGTRRSAWWRPRWRGRCGGGVPRLAAEHQLSVQVAVEHRTLSISHAGRSGPAPVTSSATTGSARPTDTARVSRAWRCTVIIEGDGGGNTSLGPPARTLAQIVLVTTRQSPSAGAVLGRRSRCRRSPPEVRSLRRPTASIRSTASRARSAMAGSTTTSCQHVHQGVANVLHIDPLRGPARRAGRTRCRATRRRRCPPSTLGDHQHLAGLRSAT